MKNKLKLAILCMSFCCVLALGIMGVLAVTQIDFVVGGNINFTADGINATIGKGTMAGGSFTTASGQSDANTMLSFNITTEESKTTIQNSDAYKSWQGLDLLFNENATDVTITFKIKNNRADADINATITTNQTSLKNAAVLVSPNGGTVISPSGEVDVIITFKVLEKDANASIEGFGVNFDLKHSLIRAEHESMLFEVLSEQDRTAYAYKKSNDISGDIVVPSKVIIGDKDYTVTQIGDNTNPGSAKVGFAQTAIESIIIPDTVKVIGNYCFYYCTSLKEVVIGNGVEDSVELMVFSGCSEITSLILGSGKIGSGVFYSNVVSLTIGKNVTSVRDNSFNMTALKTVIFESKTPTSVFNSTVATDVPSSITFPEGVVVYVPSESLEAYKTSQYWSSNADLMV